MFKKQLIMAFLAGAVVVGSGLLIVGHVAGGTPRDVPTLTPQRKAVAAQHLVVPQLTPKPLGGPIAYGFIKADGTIVAGSGNFTCNSMGDGYFVHIASINYLEGGYLTFVTPANESSAWATTWGYNDTLIIRMFSTNPYAGSGMGLGNSVRILSAFQFITYKIL